MKKFLYETADGNTSAVLEVPEGFDPASSIWMPWPVGLGLGGRRFFFVGPACTCEGRTSDLVASDIHFNECPST